MCGRNYFNWQNGQPDVQFKLIPGEVGYQTTYSFIPSSLYFCDFLQPHVKKHMRLLPGNKSILLIEWASDSKHLQMLITVFITESGSNQGFPFAYLLDQFWREIIASQNGIRRKQEDIKHNPFPGLLTSARRTRHMRHRKISLPQFSH